MFLMVSGTMRNVTQRAGWERLGARVVHERARRSFRSRTAFAAHVGLSARTLGDIELGRRVSYGAGTLALIEQAFGWTPGSCLDVVSGGEPSLQGVTVSHEESGDPRVDVFVAVLGTVPEEDRADVVRRAVERLRELGGPDK